MSEFEPESNASRERLNRLSEDELLEIMHAPITPEQASLELLRRVADRTTFTVMGRDDNGAVELHAWVEDEEQPEEQPPVEPEPIDMTDAAEAVVLARHNEMSRLMEYIRVDADRLSASGLAGYIADRHREITAMATRPPEGEKS